VKQPDVRPSVLACIRIASPGSLCSEDSIEFIFSQLTSCIGESDEPDGAQHRAANSTRFIMQTSNARAAAAKAEAPLNDRERSSFADCRILVVDDNIINCQVAVHILRKLGCDADAITVSRDAVSAHRRQPYDLILMDCQMPELDGFQATAQIRAAETPGWRAAIIGWTTTWGSDQWEKCMVAGMDDMITKPISPQAAQSMIRRWRHSAALRPLSDIAEAADDLASTQQRFGTSFAEIAALYQSETPKRIAAMRCAADERNDVRLAAIAHVLSGSCASIGAIRLGMMCRELETSCKTGMPGNVEACLGRIEDEYADTVARIRTLLGFATP
jgi:CheY-like chemotaxis protein